MQEHDFSCDFDEKFRSEYQQGEGHCDPTNPANQFDEKPSEAGKSTTHASAAAACQLAAQVAPISKALLPKELTPEEEDQQLQVYGHPVADFINTMFPKGVPIGSRHQSALKLASDLMIQLDGNEHLVLVALKKLSWVQEIIVERGEKEIDDIIDAAKKRLKKRESETLSDLRPSREMQRAIKEVTGRDYNALVREQRSKALGQAATTQDDILHVLERIGTEMEKLTPYYPLMRLLCFRLKRKYYAASFFVGAAFATTLMTRCWYEFWPKKGKHSRLNTLVMLIGRMGSMKSIARDLYDILMEPIRKADAAQIAALNAFNTEREQNNGGAKNKSPRPKGIYRALPPETSTAALREAEANSHETVDGLEVPLHVSQFDTELQNTLGQLKKGHMDALQTYWLKCYHNEPHGAYLKTSSAPVGETPVHFNAVYTGTSDALRRINTEVNNVNGLMSRFTIVPNADSNFEMLEVHDYDDAARKRDADLLEWAYKFNACKGEIPCKLISDALHLWTTHRMTDAGEDHDFAEEDLVKRPCWHGINFALPFVVSRHWDKMVQDEDGRWKCGPDFKVDKTDVRLAILIANAQLAFQEHFCKGILDLHYDEIETEKASNVRHQQKTLLGYRRLPNPFTSEDVDECFGYEGKAGSICSKLKRLCDQGLAEKITRGEDKGKYRKLM